MLQHPSQQELGLPQGSMQHRPWYARSSGMTTSSKSSSFFEPFDFEKPESYDFELPEAHVKGGGGKTPRQLSAIDEHGPDWPLPTHRR